MSKVVVIDDAYRQAEEEFSRLSTDYGIKPTKEQLFERAREIRLERAKLTR